MSTSEAAPETLAQARPDPSPATPDQLLFADALAQLANQVLSQFPHAPFDLLVKPPDGAGSLSGWPGLTAPFSSLGPSATRPSAAGVSTASTAPPTPGPLVAPPPASAPPPRENDLRSVPTLLADNLGFSSPLVVAQPPSTASTEATVGSYQPYFLDGLHVPQDHGPATGPALDGSAPAGPSGPAAPPASGRTLTSTAPTPTPTPGYPSLPTSLSSFPVTSVPASLSPGTSASHGSESPVEVASPASLSHSGFQVQPELVPLRGATPGLFDAATIRRDFPILDERVHGRPLIWLDNAATTQKPRAVIERLKYFYEHENSNVHRAAHALAARATDAYEGARDKVRRFLNAPSAQEIVFVRGATEAINLVAQSWGRRNVRAGDEIVITWLEHHANIVPWQQLCAEKGARLCVAPVDSQGQVILEEYEKLLGPRTRLVAFAHVSNALGTIVPVREMVAMAHRHGALALVDGAQAVSHLPVDVQALDCDFYCLSGHKVFAPTGIGALFGKAAILADMPPWQGGGNMISDVTFEKTTYQPAPLRFEAGTGSIADAVGLGAALDYVDLIGRPAIERYEHDLLRYATDELKAVPGLRLIGTAPEKAGVLSFVLDGIRTEDVGAALDREGIAVRSGHHCAQPILRRFGLQSTVRASLAPYNTCEDIDALVTALLRLQAGRPRGLSSE